MLLKPNSWLFQPRKIHSLTLPCTSTIKRLSRFHQLNFLGFGSPAIFPRIFMLIIFCKKARRTIGYIHRAFLSAPIITRRILYLALVCPILEYGSITWQPLNKSLTNRLESCQRFACGVFLQQWNDSHEDLVLESDLPLLAKRRDIAILCRL